MAAGWGEGETNALIEVWGAAEVQSQLDAVSDIIIIYQRISRDLQQLGYTKTWQQCKTKIKNLTQKYRKVSDF